MNERRTVAVSEEGRREVEAWGDGRAGSEFLYHEGIAPMSYDEKLISSSFAYI